jgi:hypothetical protein
MGFHGGFDFWINLRARMGDVIKTFLVVSASGRELAGSQMRPHHFQPDQKRGLRIGLVEQRLDDFVIQHRVEFAGRRIIRTQGVGVRKHKKEGAHGDQKHAHYVVSFAQPALASGRDSLRYARR